MDHSCSPSRSHRRARWLHEQEFRNSWSVHTYAHRLWRTSTDTQLTLEQVVVELLVASVLCLIWVPFSWVHPTASALHITKPTPASSRSSGTTPPSCSKASASSSSTPCSSPAPPLSRLYFPTQACPAMETGSAASRRPSSASRGQRGRSRSCCWRSLGLSGCLDEERIRLGLVRVHGVMVGGGHLLLCETELNWSNGYQYPE